MNKSLAAMQPHVAGNHVAGGQFHHVAGHQFLERNFLRLPVAHHRGGDLDHRLELGRRVVGLGFLHEAQRNAQHHHGHHHPAADGVAGTFRRGKSQDGEDRQQNHQRVADGDPKPVQPLVLFFLRDLVGAEFLQPRRRRFLAQARGRGAPLLQHGGDFPRCGVMHQIGILWIGRIILARHNISPLVAGRNTTSRAGLASFGWHFLDNANAVRLTLRPNRPILNPVRGANRPSVGTMKAESFARNAKDPLNLIQVMLAKGGHDSFPAWLGHVTRHPTPVTYYDRDQRIIRAAQQRATARKQTRLRRRPVAHGRPRADAGNPTDAHEIFHRRHRTK